MENLKLLQCYNCFQYCHTRNNCSNNTICSRCGRQHEHSYTECNLTPECSNCGDSHVATARICPKYIEAFISNEQQVARQLSIKYPQYFTTSPATPPRSSFNSTSQDHDILRAARLASNTPSEFAEQLFNATSTLINPHASPTPSLAFDCELNESIDSIEEDIEDPTSTIPPQTVPVAESKTLNVSMPESKLEELKKYFDELDHKTICTVTGPGADTANREVVTKCNIENKTLKLWSLDPYWHAAIHKEDVTDFKRQSNIITINLTNSLIYTLEYYDLNNEPSVTYAKQCRYFLNQKLEFPLAEKPHQTC